MIRLDESWSVEAHLRTRQAEGALSTLYFNMHIQGMIFCVWEIRATISALQIILHTVHNQHFGGGGCMKLCNCEIGQISRSERHAVHTKDQRYAIHVRGSVFWEQSPKSTSYQRRIRHSSVSGDVDLKRHYYRNLFKVPNPINSLERYIQEKHSVRRPEALCSKGYLSIL